MSTHNIPFLNIKKKIILNYPESMGFFPRNPRPSRGKRAISVRAIEVLLYILFLLISAIDGACTNSRCTCAAGYTEAVYQCRQRKNLVSLSLSSLNVLNCHRYAMGSYQKFYRH